MEMRGKHLAGALAVAAALLAFAPAAAHANPMKQIPVTGTAAGQPFTGLLDIYGFRSQGTRVFAYGVLSGVPGAAPSAVEIPVDLASTANGGASPKGMMSIQAAGSCDILNLVLGPLDLNLLGLQVHLDQVVLNITAQQGPGNLLGNLLCAITGLLDGLNLNALLTNLLTNLLNGLLGSLFP
jgi:hypothetical protein